MRFGKLAFGVVVAVLSLGANPPPLEGAPNVSSLSHADVTVYGAKWCSACKTLEAGLKEKDIPFDLIDVDDSPGAYEKAKSASGAASVIPLTSVMRESNTTWFVGADVNGIAKAYRGE